jgi:hypothetical protein
LSIRTTASTAQYGNGGKIIANGLATDETLLGKE